MGQILLVLIHWISFPWASGISQTSAMPSLDLAAGRPIASTFSGNGCPAWRSPSPRQPTPAVPAGWFPNDSSLGQPGCRTASAEP
jgi:hypothetical protein